MCLCSLLIENRCFHIIYSDWDPLSQLLSALHTLKSIFPFLLSHEKKIRHLKNTIKESKNKTKQEKRKAYKQIEKNKTEQNMDKDKAQEIHLDPERHAHR